MAQEPRPANEIAVRTAGAAPATVVESIRTTMMSLDPDLPVRSLRPAATTIARANYGLGVLSRILSALGVLGLGLASLGIYGVISRAVAERTTEFGIRLALGAVAEDITRLVLTSGTKLALVGSALGLLGAVGFSRLIGSAFPNMEASSPLAMAAVALLLMGVALVACYLPARHVSRISPAETLKSQ
jgi:ABC-type antimicrobial peptide transport system permease subunit